jgi:hypothetical protein
MRRNGVTRGVLLMVTSVLGVLLLTTGVGSAATRHVETNGVDDPGCGAPTSPCRTITHAIARAGAGGRVVVGPGRYGDLDEDGVLGGVGEEPVPGPCGCMIHITQRVTIESTAGAGATVLRAPILNTLVKIEADDVVFGKPNRGFTLTGGFQGLVLNSPFSGGKIEDNVFLGSTHAVSIGGSDHTIAGNAAIGNAGEGFVIGGIASTGIKFIDNLASGNGQSGVTLAGQRFKATGNVASNNDNVGFRVSYTGVDATFSGNIAVGNGDKGIVLGTATTLSAMPIARRNVATGNRRGGIFIGGAVQVTESNIFGNGVILDGIGPGGGTLNCGITYAASLTIPAENNFWGASTGPGADPADAACNKGTGSIDTVPFATKAFGIPSGAGQ